MINDFFKSFFERIAWYTAFPMIYVVVGFFISIGDGDYGALVWLLKWIVLPLAILALINTVREFIKRQQQYKNLSTYKTKIDIENSGQQIIQKYNLLFEKIKDYKDFVFLSSLSTLIQNNTMTAEELQSSIVLLSIFDPEFDTKVKEISSLYSKLNKEAEEYSSLIDKILNENKNALIIFADYWKVSESLLAIIRGHNTSFEKTFDYDEFKLLQTVLKTLQDEIEAIYTYVLSSDNIENASTDAITKLNSIKDQIPNVSDYEENKESLAHYFEIEILIKALIQSISDFHTQYQAFLKNDKNSEISSIEIDLESLLNQMYQSTRQSTDFYLTSLDEYNNKFISFKDDQKELLKIYEFNALENIDKKKKWITQNGYFSLLFENKETKEFVNFLDDVEMIKIFLDTDAKKLSLFSLSQSNESKWSAFFAQLTGHEERDEIVSLLRSINDNRYFKPVKNFVLSQKSDLTEEQRELVRRLTTLL
jgi:hypothetical protein